MAVTTTQLWLPSQAQNGNIAAAAELPLRVGAATATSRYVGKIRRNLVATRQPADALGFALDTVGGDGATVGGRGQLQLTDNILGGLGATAAGFYRVEYDLFLETGYTTHRIDLLIISRTDAGEDPNRIIKLSIENSSSHIRWESINSSNANESGTTTVVFPLKKVVTLMVGLEKVSGSNHRYNVTVRMKVDGVVTDVIALTNRQAFGSVINVTRLLVRPTGGTVTTRGLMMGYRFLTCDTLGELWNEPTDQLLTRADTSGIGLGTVYATFAHGDTEGGLGTLASPYTRADILTSPNSVLLPSGSGWRWLSDGSQLALANYTTKAQVRALEPYIIAGLLYPDGCKVRLTDGLHRLTNRWEANSDALEVFGGGRGVTIVSGMKTIAANAWTLNADSLYETTDRATGCYVFWGDLPLEKITGANYAAVKATLQATPNSFYNDTGTAKLYIKPPTGVDPTTATTLFKRTNDSFGGAILFELKSKNVLLRDLTCQETALANPTLTDLTGGYGYNLASSGPGLQACGRVEVKFADKHAAGCVRPAGTTGARCLNFDIVAGYCNPSGGFGSATVFVDFVESSADPTGNVSVWSNARISAAAFVYGSAAGAASGNILAYTAHYNPGSGGTAGDVGDCAFYDSDLRTAGYAQMQDTGTVLLVENTLFDVTPRGTLVTISGCNTGAGSTPFPGALLSYSRITFARDNPNNTQGESRANGTTTADHCTLDLSGTSGAATSCLFLTAASNLDLDYTVIILPAGKALIGDVGANLTITGTRTVFIAPDGPSHVLFRGYGSGVANRTLADMQAASLLTDAVLYPSLAAAGIKADGTLTPNSPLRGRAADGGPGVDSGGDYYQSRVNIGGSQDSVHLLSGAGTVVELSTGRVWRGY